MSSPAVVITATGRHASGSPSRWPDRVFRGVTLLAASLIGLLVVLVAWQLYHGSQQALHAFGLRFLFGSDWDPVNDHYGALPFIFGTFVSSLIGLLIAVPLSVGAALYLTTWRRCGFGSRLHH